MQDFAEKLHLPATVGFRCQDLFDNTHPNYVGDLGLGIDPALVDMVQAADLLIVVGERLGEASTKGYTLSRHPAARRKAGACPSRAPTNSASSTRPTSLIAATSPISPKPWPTSAGRSKTTRSDWIAAGRRAYDKKIAPKPSRIGARRRAGGEISARDAARRRDHHQRRRHLHRLCAPLLHLPALPTQLAPTSGAMGYGFPAAIAAKMRASRPAGRLLCRRRLLPDGVAGAGDRDPLRACRSSSCW